MNKSILVTGAGGYIGKFVVKSLLDFGAKVIAVDINKKNIDSRAEIIEYDIFSEKKDIFDELGRPDVCLHLAWKDGFVHNSEAHIENLYSHYCFAKNMIDAGLQQLVVMGSMHEIGYFEGMIDENTVTRPKSFYGIAKNALREFLNVYKEEHPFKLQWLRGYYILGDDFNNNSIFTKILKAEKEGKETFPLNLGVNKNDFIHVTLLAQEIALVVLQEEVEGIINCCSGKPISLKEKVEEFIDDRELLIKPEYGVFPERSYDSPIVYGDTTKIKNIVENTMNRSDISGKIDELLKLLNIF